MYVEIYMKQQTVDKINLVNKITTPNKIDILNLLIEKDTCVCEMVQILNLKHNLISHHLKVLLDANIIESTKDGQHVIYNLKPEKKDFIKNILAIIK